MGVIGAAGLQVFHDLGAAIARALNDGVKPVFSNSSVIGMPATVEYRASGTMVSPWPPSTNAVTFSTLTLSSCGDKGAEAR